MTELLPLNFIFGLRRKPFPVRDVGMLACFEEFYDMTFRIHP